jgi:hypothetical protein
VSNLKIKVAKDINLEKTNFGFFADKSDILIKNILSETEFFKISSGDIKLKLSSETSLESNFKINLKYNDRLKNYINLFEDYKYAKNLVGLEIDLGNRLTMKFDETYKLKNYDYKSNGKILKADFNFEKPIQNYFLDDEIQYLSLIDSDIKTHLSSKQNKTNISGKYSINKNGPLSFNLENILGKELLKLKLDIEYSNPIVFNFINYVKPKDTIANISIDLDKKKENIKIKKLSFNARNDSISIEDLNLNKNKFLSFKKILVKTSKNEKNNNDFKILYDKKISIKGTQFDASNLPKFLNSKSKSNQFLNINKDIEIDLTNILAPLSENLRNFKLLGKIEKGKFTKISSKGNFGGNNFLDITMKEDKNNQKKYLEIYSDLTKPLLTEYDFFNGLTGGKLLYTSIIDKNKSNSQLKIENFKVINAPGMVKLLSLADLSGLADIAEGEGLTFDVLEISMEKNKETLKLNEILALGPSISVLIEGYQDPTITSLRGTLVPAKTLNRMISKIPVIGNVIIPKEVGEGLFGISFKMKGPKGKIKTTINPIKTITPRFIQKIIEKNKEAK